MGKNVVIPASSLIALRTSLAHRGQMVLPRASTGELPVSGKHEKSRNAVAAGCDRGWRARRLRADGAAGHSANCAAGPLAMV